MKIKIKQIREQKSMCINELSAKSGVARGYLTELEQGKYNNPSIKVLCKLSKTLGCKIDDLVDCDN